MRVGDSGVEESSLYSNRRTAGETNSLPYALQAPFLVPEAVAGVLRARRWRHPVWMIGGPGAGAYEVSRALHENGDPIGFVSARQVVSSATDLEERIRGALDSEPLIEAMSLYVERIERQPLAVQERILRWSDEGTRRGARPISIRLLAQSLRAHQPRQKHQEHQRNARHPHRRQPQCDFIQSAADSIKKCPAARSRRGRS